MVQPNWTSALGLGTHLIVSVISSWDHAGTSIWQRLGFNRSASDIPAICLSIYKYLLASRDITMYVYMPSTVRICKQKNFAPLRQHWN